MHNEEEIFLGESPAPAELSLQEELFSTKIEYREEGKRLELSRSESGLPVLYVNVKKFKTPAIAERVAVEELAFLHALQKLKNEQAEVYALVSKKESFLALVRILGLNVLKKENPTLVKKIRRIHPDSHSPKEDFHFACAQYVFYGEVPESLHPRFKALLGELPLSQGQNSLDVLGHENFSVFRQIFMYENEIHPRFKSFQKTLTDKDEERYDQNIKDSRFEDGEALSPVYDFLAQEPIPRDVDVETFLQGLHKPFVALEVLEKAKLFVRRKYEHTKHKNTVYSYFFLVELLQSLGLSCRARIAHYPKDDTSTDFLPFMELYTGSEWKVISLN